MKMFYFKEGIPLLDPNENHDSKKEDSAASSVTPAEEVTEGSQRLWQDCLILLLLFLRVCFGRLTFYVFLPMNKCFSCCFHILVIFSKCCCRLLFVYFLLDPEFKTGSFHPNRILFEKYINFSKYWFKRYLMRLVRTSCVRPSRLNCILTMGWGYSSIY